MGRGIWTRTAAGINHKIYVLYAYTRMGARVKLTRESWRSNNTITVLPKEKDRLRK
jgi:hypothetical protein